MIRIFVFAAALGLPFAAAQAQDDRFAGVVITSETAGPGVEVLYGAGGNIALAHGKGEAFLVDDQYAPLTDRIMAKVRELAGTDVKFVVNTHWHGDHSGGNENFGKAGALIVAHDNVRRRMSTEQTRPGADGERVTPASPAAALPVITFRDRQTIHSAGQTIRAVHVQRAHTDGDALVKFMEANVLHMGDTFFDATAGTFPFIDRGSGGSIQGLIDAVDMGLKMSDAETAVIPGHGRLTDRDGLAAYRGMLADVRDRVKVMVDAGTSRDDVIAAKPAAAYAEGRAGGFIKPDTFVGAVYDSLTAPAAHSHAGGDTHSH
ncbi:MBL fold metallo-hydrolase [Pacificimonas sp. WHA3]|uniref:MBL fold metallo-hydrolase n=1 Tax=Pacificimonas pallii TaxID=2827236 RepID=A0ABS6SB89_9SPHN|nr:MBL fold metallo-hydrolase [Pacificimonas pallii]MBV7255688.1 MBL fold metallo-hydrolase [Pacificimonas pallii]